ncbi:response regulator [Aurantivibrio plasticivorans]
MARPRKEHLILFVDDDPDDQYLLSSAVNKMDDPPQFRAVGSAEDMFSFLQDCEAQDPVTLPSLILLDLNMPGIDGKEALFKLRSSSAYSCIPVVVYTTSNSDYDINDSYRLGASSFIRKPATLSDMQTCMETLCRYWFDVVALSVN